MKRRQFLRGLGASLIAAPVIAKGLGEKPTFTEKDLEEKLEKVWEDSAIDNTEAFKNTIKRREALNDAIFNIRPQDTPFFTNTKTKHEMVSVVNWLEK
jgi:hypothetical protein